MVADGAEQHYDAFLSYNRADQRFVGYIATKLKGAGLVLFVDTAEILAGDHWVSSLESALSHSSSVVIFLGNSGLGRWQTAEVDAALRLSTGGSPNEIRVIPVLLPGVRSDQIANRHLFLARASWVKFRIRNDQYALELLVAAIKRTKPQIDRGNERVRYAIVLSG